MQTPQMTDAILKSLGRRRGPAVDTSAKDIATAYGAQEFAKLKAAEDAQARINLGLKSLAIRKAMAEKERIQRGEQFDIGLAEQGRQFELSTEESGRQFGGKLGLEQARLSQAGEQFSDILAYNKDIFAKKLGLAQNELAYAKKSGKYANILAGLGLGIGALDSLSESKRLKQKEQFRNDLIKKYNDIGTQQSAFYARLIELLEE